MRRNVAEIVTGAEVCVVVGSEGLGLNREPNGIIVGQRVTDVKLQLSRDLRRRMTPAEQKLWGALRGSRLVGLRFRRQQVIAGFIVDFYCDAARIVVEVDGGIHEEQQGHDAARDKILAGRGLHVVRFTNDDVIKCLPKVLEQIAAIAAAARSLACRPQPT